MPCVRSLLVPAAISLVSALLLISLVPSPAQAQSCDAATSQAAMTACGAAAAKKSDARLNATYMAVMARLSPAGKLRMRDAQRAWLAFRDKQCLFESNGVDGGSIAPMVAQSCAMSVTDDRVKALSRFRTCAEGDISCPR
jgi:uncharacterized protein YecT (DUF1311 family)